MDYYLAADYKSGNCHVRVHRPVLTPEESARRYKQIHDAAAALMMSVYAAEKARKEKNNEIGNPRKPERAETPDGHESDGHP